MRVSLNKEMTVIADSCPAKGPQKTALGHVPKYTSLFITLMVENGADFIVYRSLCSKSPFSTILRHRAIWISVTQHKGISYSNMRLPFRVLNIVA
mmetsp:Transcript_2026/g.3222  ORF Transcript_2026/g.3222 Transcript_2026/m.3222 type:complete len:95 (-) Transcript_2026:796-1080(-)